jgi:hypothetical protein
MLHPVFKRELLSRLRDPLFRWAVLAYLIIPFIFVFGSWPRNQAYYGGSTDSENLVTMFFLVQMIVALIVIPVFGAFTINDERENKTYDFLYISLYQPWTTSMAKLGAILVSGFILFLCTAPVLSFVFYLGGVDELMLLGYSIALLVDTIITAEIAVLFSAIFKKGYVSLIASYLFFLVFWFTGVEMELLRVLEGLYTYLLQFLSITLTMFSGRFVELVCISSFALILFSIICLPLIVFLTRSPGEPLGLSRTKIIESEEELRQRQRKWPYYIIDPAKRAPPIADHENPLLPKERLSNRFFNSAWRWRSFYIFFFLTILLIAVLSFSRSSDDLSFMYSVAGVGILVTWNVVTHSLALSSERENRSLENLKLTQLTPFDFLWSKWRVCFQLRWPLMAICFVTSIGLYALGSINAFRYRSDFSEYFGFLFIFTTLLEAACLTPLLVGLCVKSVKTNVTVSLSILMGILFLPALIYGWMFQRQYPGYGMNILDALWYSSAYENFIYFKVISSICLAAWIVVCLIVITQKLRTLWKPE